MKKIGLFGGSFDPIHFGHLNLALEMLEKRGLDEVWFCPVNISPFKMHNQPHIEASHRLKMLALALDDIPSFHFLENEMKREGPSYTVETLRELHNQYPQHEFFLILGDDAVSHFFNWHQPEEITSLAKLLVGQRDFQKPNNFKGSTGIQKAIEEGLTPTRVMDISSTDLRQRLENKLYCRHLIPAKVMDYISKNDLYS